MFVSTTLLQSKFIINLFHRNRPRFSVRAFVGSGGLTVEALAKHDAKEGDHEDSSMLDAQSEGRGSAGGRTMSTWASNWTDCTNVTFGRVHRYWSSSSALHKEVYIYNVNLGQ